MYIYIFFRRLRCTQLYIYMLLFTVFGISREIRSASKIEIDPQRDYEILHMKFIVS